MRDRILKVFAEALNLPNDVNTDELVYNVFRGWDSVAHMTLVAGLETEFDCMLEMDDILAMERFEAVVEIMERVAGAA
jgi:acyl carrier protein